MHERRSSGNREYDRQYDQEGGEDDNRRGDILFRLLGLGELLWASRGVVALGTAVGILLGVAYALLAPKVYMSNAVIYPKEVSAGTETSLLGGRLSGTLNSLSGVSNLHRVDIVLKSPELAEVVIREQELLPKLLPERWDAATGQWKGEPPALHEGAKILRQRISTHVNAYKLTLEIKVRAGDAGVAHGILRGYLEALNERMKLSVIRDAEANRKYLEAQLEKTYDPWTRDKIQQLILRQMETGMMLNANAFEVLEGPVYPRLRERPVRTRIVVGAAIAAFMLACAGVLVAAALHNWRSTLPRG
jgi:LPS O-antigen subunit length determinant protein (WzzB/FepE family)